MGWDEKKKAKQELYLGDPDAIARGQAVKKGVTKALNVMGDLVYKAGGAVAGSNQALTNKLIGYRKKTAGFYDTDAVNARDPNYVQNRALTAEELKMTKKPAKKKAAAKKKVPAAKPAALSRRTISPIPAIERGRRILQLPEMPEAPEVLAGPEAPTVPETKIAPLNRRRFTTWGGEPGGISNAQGDYMQGTRADGSTWRPNMDSMRMLNRSTGQMRADERSRLARVERQTEQDAAAEQRAAGINRQADDMEMTNARNLARLRPSLANIQRSNMLTRARAEARANETTAQHYKDTASYNEQMADTARFTAGSNAQRIGIDRFTAQVNANKAAHEIGLKGQELEDKAHEVDVEANEGRYKQGIDMYKALNPVPTAGSKRAGGSGGAGKISGQTQSLVNQWVSMHEGTGKYKDPKKGAMAEAKLSSRYGDLSLYKEPTIQGIMQAEIAYTELSNALSTNANPFWSKFFDGAKSKGGNTVSGADRVYEMYEIQKALNTPGQKTIKLAGRNDVINLEQLVKDAGPEAIGLIKNATDLGVIYNALAEKQRKNKALSKAVGG